MTNCKGMIEAFRLGGDFHSRTALVSWDACDFDVGDVS